MRNKIILLILTLQIGQGCNYQEKDTKDVPFLPSLPSIEIKSTLLTKDIIIVPPSQIELVEDRLFLFRSGDGHAAKIIKTDGSDRNESFSRMGQGPGEHISPYFAGYDSIKKAIYIWDVSLMVMCEYACLMDDDTCTFVETNRKRRENEVLYYVANYLENDLFVAALARGSDNANYFISLDQNLNVTKEFGNLPFINDIKGLNLTRMRGVMASLKNQFVFGGMQYGYIAGYRVMDNGEIHKKWDYLVSEPQYEIKQGTVTWKDDNKTGFFDLKMNSNYIFALYCGEILSSEDLAQTLFVFDQEGNLLKTFTLDKRCSRIAVSEDNIVYALALDLDPIIVRYDLSDYLRISL
jgi:hypothetical protein